MIKAIFFDVGGVLFLNDNGRGYLNESIVEFIKNHGEFVYGILSSTDLDPTPTLQQFMLQSYFSLVQTTGKVGIAKDSPDFFIRAAKAIGLPPDEIIMVDNDEPFLEAAKLAGMHIIAYEKSLNLEIAVSSLTND